MPLTFSLQCGTSMGLKIENPEIIKWSTTPPPESNHKSVCKEDSRGIVPTHPRDVPNPLKAGFLIS